jgi:hypothetical protein
LQRLIVIGNVNTAPEHQVLEKMREAGSVLLLIAGAYVVQNVHANKRGAFIEMVNDGEAVGKLEFFEMDHGA